MNTHTLRRIVVAMVLTLTTAAATLTVAPTAAHAYGVEGRWAPNNEGTSARGWANIYNTDCFGGAICDTYMKIERGSWRGWQYQGGGWVSARSGWTSMAAAKTSGCYDYRTVIELYVTEPELARHHNRRLGRNSEPL